MPQVIETTVYSFDELDESAKDKARAWYRDSAMDYDWWDCTYEDAAQCATVLGIGLNQKPVKLMNGTTRYDPAIWFSGFASQGDGACFEGKYAYAKGSAKAIRQHAGLDTELHRIADTLTEVQRRNFYRIEAKTAQCGHYMHSGCMTVDTWRTDGIDLPEGDDETVRQCLRDFADWIYRQLNAEYDWHIADARMDESILANEYQFKENGSIA